MAAKIRKGDLVEVVRGRTSDEKELAKRNARRAEQGLEPLKPGDKGLVHLVTGDVSTTDLALVAHSGFCHVSHSSVPGAVR